MSKYDPLWQYIGTQTVPELIMSFEEIKQILGFPIDHSFLNYKKELLEYGYGVVKISLKNKSVQFIRLPSGK